MQETIERSESGSEGGDGGNVPSAWDLLKDKFRKEYSKLSLKQAAMKMAELERWKEREEVRLKQIMAAYDILRMEIIPEKMEAEEVESPYNLKAVGRISLTPDIFIHTPTAQRDGLAKWLKRNKLGSVVTTAINASTLKAIIKGRIKAGKPIPSEHVKITPYTRASITGRVDPPDARPLPDSHSAESSQR